MTTVLRLKAGDPICAIDRLTGDTFQALIVETGNILRIKITAPIAIQHVTSRVHTLCFALTKGNRNDWVAEKACELGAQRIIFWGAERSVVKLKHTDAQGKIERWQRLAEAAARQCGSRTIPSIALALSLNELLALLSAESAAATTSVVPALLVCSLSPQARELRELDPPAETVTLVIGPEGDLSPAEEKLLSQQQTTFISLGPRTLRSETAALAAVAAVNAAWGWLIGPPANLFSPR